MHKQLSLPIQEDIRLLIDTVSRQISNRISSSLQALQEIEIDDKGSSPDLPPNIFQGSLRILELKPEAEPTLIVSIDSSCIALTRGLEGATYALRAAAVFYMNMRIQGYITIGPLIIQLTEKNGLIYFKEERRRLKRLVLTDEEWAEHMLRVRAERSVQLELAQSLSDSIIVADGSLRASLFESQRESLARIITACRAKGNVMIGISKASRIPAVNRFSTILSSCDAGPAVADIHEYVAAELRRVFGHILLVKFSVHGLPVRVDVSILEKDSYCRILSRLLYNDAFRRGYPESLRLAHHLSVFSGADRLSLESYLARRIGGERRIKWERRRVLLGSFGG